MDSPFMRKTNFIENGVADRNTLSLGGILFCSKIVARSSVCTQLYSWSLPGVIQSLVEVLNKVHTKRGTDIIHQTDTHTQGGYRVAPQLKIIPTPYSIRVIFAHLIPLINTMKTQYFVSWGVGLRWKKNCKEEDS